MENVKDIVAKKQWFECVKCNQKMEVTDLGGSSTAFDLFGTKGTNKAFYCNNKECDMFGYITLAGIRKEE
jgi:hypothetical protein